MSHSPCLYSFTKISFLSHGVHNVIMHDLLNPKMAPLSPSVGLTEISQFGLLNIVLYINIQDSLFTHNPMYSGSAYSKLPTHVATDHGQGTLRPWYWRQRSNLSLYTGSIFQDKWWTYKCTELTLINFWRKNTALVYK